MTVSVIWAFCWAAATSAGGDEVFLRASQIGYRPGDPKLAVAFSGDRFDGTFRVVKADSDETVLEGKAEALPGASWGRFPWHAELDFSALRRPGRFRLAVGDCRSLPFSIGDDAFLPVPDTLLEFMRHQRCGYNPWLDAECHPHDGRTTYRPEPSGTYVDARGQVAASDASIGFRPDRRLRCTRWLRAHRSQRE